MALSTISGTTGITDASITSVKLADFAAAVDLNGVELILDADQDTSITADTDDVIDFKIAGVEHISLSNSSGDTIIKPRVDAKDIIFQQFDGNKLFCIDDGNFVSVGGNATAPGEIRIYEDTDLGTNYSGFKVGNLTASVAYQLPLADGTSGFQLTTNGSGVLTWTSAGTTLANDANNRVVTGTGSGLNGEANLTFDGSTLTNAGATQLNSTLTVGANDQGFDVILHGDTASANVTFDTSADDLIFNGVAGLIVPEGQFTLGSTAVTSTAAEINLLDGVSGLVQADLTKLAAVDATAAEINLLDGVSGLVQADLTKLAAVDATAAEINLIDGGATVGTTAIADGDGLLINDAGTMRVSTVQTLSAYLDDEITSMPNLTSAAALVTVSALDTGSITPGFGAIDNGAKTIRSATITAETAFVPDAQDGAALGTTSLQFSDLFLADGAVIGMGDDNEVTLTHVHDAGLLLNSTMKLQFNDATQFVQGISATVLGLGATDEIDLTATLVDVNANLDVSGTITSAGTVQGTTITATTAFVPDASDGAALGTTALEFSDLFLADGAVIALGDDQEVTITHNHNVGIIMLAGSADDGCRVSLQTRETTVVAGDRIGDIDFKAPLEGSGTDAILTCARIRATAEGTFAADNNATSLQFFTAASEESVEKMTLTSTGILNTNKIGVITDHDLGDGIHIRTSDSSATANAAANELVIEANANSGISILSSTSTAGRIYFGDSGDDDIGQIRYNHDDNSMNFKVNGLADAMVIHSNGMITQALQPLFKIQQTGALSVADGHNLFSTNITEAYDVNADVASNGQFTAPVDGYYQFHASILYESIGANDTDTVEDTFTSSNQSEIIARYGKLNNALSSGGFCFSANSTILFMDANDTCKCVHSDGGTMAVHPNAPASHFEGRLVQ